MRPDLDLVILGGGCAGLSLARRLAASNVDAPRVAVIEPRTSYQADRTWAFWEGNGVDGVVEPLIERRWPTWRVGSRNRTVVHHAPSRPYAVVPSARFYADAECAIASSVNVRLLRGARATGLVERPNGVRIETDRGALTASHVVDVRPPTRQRVATAILFQTFVGAEIELDRPSFDAGAVELMTDMSFDEDGFVFSYVLPFSRRRALIEVTRFIATPRLPARLERDLDDAIAERVAGASHRVTRRERGVLPMGLEAVRAASLRIVPAGTAAGAGRPATGYAFLRIQRWAHACAAAVRRGHPPMPHPPDPLLMRNMDRLFLRVLRNDAELAPKLFLDLATGVRAEGFARFLSDEATPGDLLAVVASLPPGPFLRTLLMAPRDGRAFARRRPA